MGPIPPNSTLIFDVELVNIGCAPPAPRRGALRDSQGNRWGLSVPPLCCARRGEGSGQKPTIWNTAVAAVLLAALTALVLHGLRETFTKHSFSDHFFS